VFDVVAGHSGSLVRGCEKKSLQDWVWGESCLVGFRCLNKKWIRGLCCMDDFPGFEEASGCWGLTRQGQ
jgi:hypothetical protein